MFWSFRSSFPDHHTIFNVSWWSSECLLNQHGILIKHEFLIFFVDIENPIMVDEMTNQKEEKNVGVVQSQGMNEKFQFYLNFHYQKLNIQSATNLYHADDDRCRMKKERRNQWRWMKEVEKIPTRAIFNQLLVFMPFVPPLVFSRHHHAFIHS